MGAAETAGARSLPLSERSSWARPRPRSSALTNPSLSGPPLYQVLLIWRWGAGGSGGPQARTLWDHAEVDEPPQRDKEPAGEGDDAHAAHAPVARSEAVLEPATQCGVRLITQPAPGELDQHAADVPVAGLADALFALAAVTGVGRRGQAHQRGGLPAIAELPPGEDLLRQQPGAGVADPLQPRELPHLPGGHGLVRQRALAALRLQLAHLGVDQRPALALPLE